MAAERRKCFRILGLQEGASEEEIRKAYKRLALQYHPDKNESDDAKSKFQEIGYAYKYLTEGPSACGTADPHDIRDEILRRMFEEMFFARFHSPFGFPFFCEESDDDDFYVYSDSNDSNCYCGSCNTKESNTRTYQTTWTPPATHTYQNVSKKKMRKKEKRQRQKERAKEHKRHGRWSGSQGERQPNYYPRTDNVNAESKKEASEKPAPKDTPEDKNDTESSRPDTPVLKQQPQKMNKKQRKKMESEQWKREKEMEEIAVELRKKQEQEMEKRKEKERLAAEKREEEKENEINYSYLFENGKKSRKARQREKKRQVSGNNNQQDLQRDDSCGSVQSEKPFHNLDSNSFPTGKMKEKNGPSIDKNMRPKSDVKKYGLNGNRYNVLDDIDDLLGPQSGSSISSSGSLKNSQVPEEKSEDTGGKAQNSGYTFQDTGRWNKTSGPTDGSSFDKRSYTPEGKRQFRSRNFQNSNRYQDRANRNNFGYVQTDNSVGTKKKTSFVPSEAMGKGNKLKDEEKSTSNSKASNGQSDDSKGETEELEDEREFVKDWSSTQIDDEDNLDDLDLGYGAKQNGHYGNGSGQTGQNFNCENKGNFGYEYNNSYQQYHQRGFPSQTREFIPKTRGYHGHEFTQFYGWPPAFPKGMAGPPRQRFQPPYHPHFRGNYVTRPAPRFRGGGYSQQRYGPPMKKRGYWHGDPGRPLPPDFPPNKNKGNIPHVHKKNMEGDSKSNKESYVKSYENDLNCEQDVREETERVSSPEISKTSKNEPSASSHFDKNKFSAFQDNQAGSRDSFDSLDDFIFETGPRTNDGAPNNRPFSSETVDIGLDEFLSKDNLGVPKGMFSESIKNYYK